MIEVFVMYLFTSLESKFTMWPTVFWPNAELESLKAFLGGNGKFLSNLGITCKLEKTMQHEA